MGEINKKEFLDWLNVEINTNNNIQLGSDFCNEVKEQSRNTNITLHRLKHLINRGDFNG